MNSIKNFSQKLNRSVIIKVSAVIVLLLVVLFTVIIYQNMKPFKTSAEHFVEAFINEENFSDNNKGKNFEITGYIDSFSVTESSGYIKCKSNDYSLCFQLKEDEIDKIPDWLCKNCKVTLRAVYDDLFETNFEFCDSEYISAVNNDLYIENTTIAVTDTETYKPTQTEKPKTTDTNIEVSDELQESDVDITQKIVYYTKSGKKYHYLNPCGRGEYYECILSEALTKGLEPCSKCVGSHITS